MDVSRSSPLPSNPAFRGTPWPLPPSCPASAPLPNHLCPIEQSEVIERKGCLPRAECSLKGHTTYWSRSYTLLHTTAASRTCATQLPATVSLPSLLLITLLVLLARAFTWEATSLQFKISPLSLPVAPATLAQRSLEICPRNSTVYRSQLRGANTLTAPPQT